jgi:hypothetical protein
MEKAKPTEIYINADDQTDAGVEFVSDDGHMRTTTTIYCHKLKFTRQTEAERIKANLT